MLKEMWSIPADTCRRYYCFNTCNIYHIKYVF